MREDIFCLSSTPSAPRVAIFPNFVVQRATSRTYLPSPGSDRRSVQNLGRHPGSPADAAVADGLRHIEARKGLPWKQDPWIGPWKSSVPPSGSDGRMRCVWRSPSATSTGFPTAGNSSHGAGPHQRSHNPDQACIPRERSAAWAAAGKKCLMKMT